MYENYYVVTLYITSLRITFDGTSYSNISLFDLRDDDTMTQADTSSHHSFDLIFFFALLLVIKKIL